MQHIPDQKRRFTALLFDADGTLYNSEPLHFEAYRRTSQELYGFDFTPKLFQQECIDNYKNPIQVLRERGIPCVDSDFRERNQPYYAALAKEKLSATKGLLELLKKAKNHGISCAVVSGASRHSVDVSLDLLGIRKYFATLITNEDTDHQKPHPQPYLLAAERIGENPSQCCAFEDAAIGISSAKEASMFCVGILNGGNTSQELKMADLIVRDFHMIQYECKGQEILIRAPQT